MTHQIALLTLAVVLATALLNLTSFLLSDSGERVVKDRLTDWYIKVEDGNWTTLITSSATVTERFLHHILGDRFFSIRYITITATAGTVYLFWLGSVIFHWNVIKTLYYVTFEVVFVVTMNACLDILSLAVTRSLLRRIAVSKGSSVPLYLAAVAATAYLVLGLASAASTLSLLSETSNREHAGAYLIHTALIMPIAFPYFAWLGTIVPTENYLALLPACFSALLLLSTLLGSWLVFLCKPLLQGPLALVLERLAEGPKGTVAYLVNALVALTGVLTAWKELLHP